MSPTLYLAWAQGLVVAGRLEEAKRTADKALERARVAHERGTEAGILRLLADIASMAALPAPEPALSLDERALVLAEELGMRPLAAECHLGLGNLYRRIGNRAKAHGHLTTAVVMYREMDLGVWLKQAETELAGTH
jgi:hypothetical protein